MGQLIKPDTRSIDIGLFSVDKACEETRAACWDTGQLIDCTSFAERTVGELTEQGSYGTSDVSAPQNLPFHQISAALRFARDTLPRRSEN